MIDTERLFIILVEGTAFIAAFAAVTGAAIMYQLTHKFGTGVIASGFKTIAGGILFIALGIIIDALNSYFLISTNNVYSTLAFLIKGFCFVAGTYIIVVGSKKTADQLESLTK
ncbi:MAG: hypothetical protein A3C30_02625 [Candidatus Levybacteria bacterium RIFCSPHIGHO2_02_FULL_40_18]|nr:MAG: hypothetical protein A2869_05350 [Candidatus Levybacteria bacterium RIFCSPHIGHO2_01_FULL_40_58]OGH26870.1 MAG: hypothetical protein A3C30_02625 [Candidatus Levybacteria bacterium RIFCSPHIGHO2_02_FULL_40_18]OGH31992.1 MAG: hypothetical protein A3E43_03605 [Candidatus Levybacteria bacterium RIFCSPHIGHO2_12_FULL_40_31]OGH40886.1 MAG: hypothetical protein A2894_04795 [Candidatus Levybacteria bacterium RIFCSPLOWO2_01_FULL_40_64]OGH49542.1 MAG: hypothetical protein A3I54_00150 [Candidatus Lev